VDDDEMMRNPVVVLDRNSESYINLRYPVLAPPPPLKKSGSILAASNSTELSPSNLKIKFEDSV